MFKKLKGFTIIETIIVVFIILILLIIILLIAKVSKQIDTDNRRISDLKALKYALELYRNDTSGASSYPNCQSGSFCLLSSNNVLNPALSVIYIKHWPRDPNFASNSDYLYIPSGCTSNSCKSFIIVSCLENNKTPLNENISNKGSTPEYGSKCPSKTQKVYRVQNNF